MGINKVILVGRTGKDPVVQYVKENTPVARFNLATSETYKDKNGEKITNTEWHNLVAWKGLAKVIEQYVKKGQQLYVEGKLTYKEYEKDGQKKYFTEIVISSIEMIGKSENSNSEQSNNDDSDLPF